MAVRSLVPPRSAGLHLGLTRDFGSTRGLIRVTMLPFENFAVGVSSSHYSLSARRSQRGVVVKALIITSYIIIFLVLAAHPSSSLASPPEEEAYRGKIVAFFESLMKGDVEGSFQNIVANSLIQGKPQELLYLIRQTKNALSIYGDIYDYKPLETDCLDERLCLSQYVSFSRNYPMLWRFIFYESREGWILLHISFNDNVKTFFDLE